MSNCLFCLHCGRPVGRFDYFENQKEFFSTTRHEQLDAEFRSCFWDGFGCIYVLLPRPWQWSADVWTSVRISCLVFFKFRRLVSDFFNLKSVITLPMILFLLVFPGSPGGSLPCHFQSSSSFMTKPVASVFVDSLVDGSNAKHIIDTLLLIWGFCSPQFP